MKVEIKNRPGVMIYFDDFRPIIDFLNDEQIGFLLRAVLAYAETGEWIVKDDDSSVKFALNTLKPKIDRDAERYEQSIWQRKYAVYSHEARKHGKEPISFEDWIALQEGARKLSAAIDR